MYCLFIATVVAVVSVMVNVPVSQPMISCFGKHTQHLFPQLTIPFPLPFSMASFRISMEATVAMALGFYGVSILGGVIGLS